MALLTTSTGGGRRGDSLRRRFVWLLGLALLGLVAPVASAQTPTSEEYQLKAAVLYRLTQFVEWPAVAFQEADSPVVVGVLGEDPFGAYLDDFVKGEKVGNHPFLVRRYKRVEDIAECHILFVSRSESGGLDKVLAPLKGRSVLTVADMDAFAQHGGMIRLIMEKGKIRFEINVTAAKASELAIKSQLLALATIVAPSGKE